MDKFEKPKTTHPIGTGGRGSLENFTARRRAFRALHEAGCFVIPNPWDVGSARYLQQLGFPALATTSAGFAFSQGLPDSEVGPPNFPLSEETAKWLRRLRTVGNTNLSVNGRGCETLNALFGVAYDRTTLNPDPQLGLLWATFMREQSAGSKRDPNFLDSRDQDIFLTLVT